MAFTTGIKFNKNSNRFLLSKRTTFGSIGPLCIELKVIWTGRVRGRDQKKKKSPQSGTSWEELVATRQTVRHCACKGALSSGRRRMCYTILAEKAVPSCVALGHGVNVCPPNLETGGENREKWYIRCTTILCIHMCMHALVTTACVEVVVCQVLGLRKSSGLFVPFGSSRGVIFFIPRR